MEGKISQEYGEKYFLNRKRWITEEKNSNINKCRVDFMFKNHLKMKATA